MPHLDEANILCVLPKALPAHVQVVLPDDAPFVAAHAAAARKHRSQRPEQQPAAVGNWFLAAPCQDWVSAQSAEVSRPLALGWQWTHAGQTQADRQSCSVLQQVSQDAAAALAARLAHSLALLPLAGRVAIRRSGHCA